jgi:hypothetical protein
LLHGDEMHSVFGQFSDMMWQDAAWRLVNEARRFTLEDGPSAAIAPILGAMLDRGYVSGQIIAISRLLERSNPQHPKKGVISLRRVVDEMDENRDLFTREIFVSHDGLPYDWKGVRARETWSTSVRWLDHSGPGAWVTAMGQHETFDGLSGTGPDNQNREDQMADAVFDRLKAVFDDPVFADVLTLRHKNVAHAADAFSRAQVADIPKGLKLEQFARAHYLLLGLMQATSTLLFGRWIGAAVPVMQSDHFKYLDSVFVRRERLRELSEFWDAHCNERDRWLTNAYHAMLPEMASASSHTGATTPRELPEGH